MLKPVTVYEVSVLLNDDKEFSCLLVSPPTVEALREAAKTDEAPTEIVEALSFFRDIDLPAEDEDEATTEITIAGAVFGSIRVVPLTAYRQPAKRGPKSAADATDTADTAATKAAKVAEAAKAAEVKAAKTAEVKATKAAKAVKAAEAAKAKAAKAKAAKVKATEAKAKTAEAAGSPAEAEAARLLDQGR